MSFISSISFTDTLIRLWEGTGIAKTTSYHNYVMIAVALVLFYLAIARDFEPLLLVPIASGMLLINIPGAESFLKGEDGLFKIIGYGVDKSIFPCLIFLGIGAMTDFSTLIANPKSLLIGAGAQVGIFITFFGATAIFNYSGLEAAAIAIIGGADGPTSVMLANLFAPRLLSPIVIAAYSYMALIPIIQPPFMKLLTTKKERLIRMKQLREVSKLEKIAFPIVVIIICGILMPDSLPLLGMLMFGNILRECKVTERLAEVASNAMINMVTIFLGLVVGSKAIGPEFLDKDTIFIILLGLFAFIMGTIGGVLTVKVMNLFSKEKINPLIGNAGVSAIPIAARISHKVGQQYDPDNYLLMHAMGANVAGSIGSVVAAGAFLAVFADKMPTAEIAQVIKAIF